MKRNLKCLMAMAGLILVVLGAMIIYNWLPEGEASKRESVLDLHKEEWGAPDKEYLDYYELGEFETRLPVIYINTNGKQILKENKIWATVAILNQGKNGSLRNVMDTPDYLAPVTINMRGASSYSRFDKKQYRIKFYKKRGGSKAEDCDFLGMGAHSEWVLNGPYLDKTLIRNRLVYNLAREVFPWAPDSRYCEVFVDGKYQGLYLAVEPVTNGESRLRLSEFGLLSGETAYVVKRDRVGTEANPLETFGKTSGKTINDLYISYPTEKKLTSAQHEWIQEDISRFEQALYSDRFSDPVVGYAAYINVNEFVDYYILNEVVMNNDAGNLSTYVYKELSGKLQLAVWDYNNCYDNYQWFEQDITDFFVSEASWFDRLLQDKNFVDRVVTRYWKLRKTVLNTEYMYARIDEYQKEVGSAVNRNFKVWGYTFQKNLLDDTSGEREIRSYAQAISQLEKSIDQRFQFMDQHIEDLYQGCVN